MENTIIKN